MKNLTTKTTRCCGLRAKISEKIVQFLPSFFARFYRCIGVKNGFEEDLEENDRVERRIGVGELITEYKVRCRRKKNGKCRKRKV